MTDGTTRPAPRVTRSAEWTYRSSLVLVAGCAKLVPSSVLETNNLICRSQSMRCGGQDDQCWPGQGKDNDEKGDAMPATAPIKVAGLFPSRLYHGSEANKRGVAGANATLKGR